MTHSHNTLVCNVQIRGIKFEVHLYEDSEYPDGEDSFALCEQQERRLVFKKSHIKETTIKHELFHGYIAASLVPDSDMTIEIMEELACEIFEQFSPLINRQAKRIFKLLKGKV